MRTLEPTRKDQITVEAESVEDALTEITAQFGENAEIMRAQKVHRGGVGGFFAKEMVQLTARRRRDASLPSLPAPSTGIADVLERMAKDADAEDSDFRTVLQRELAAGGPANDDGEAVPAWAPTPDEPKLAVGEPVAAESMGFPVAEELPDESVVPAFAETTVASEQMPSPVVVGPVLIESPEPATEAQDPVVDDDLDPRAGTVIPVELPTEDDHEEAVEVDEIVAVEQVASAGPDWWRTAETVDAPEGMGSVEWSTTSLLRLGLPAPVIAAVTDLDANDDLGWIDSIAAAVAPHCGPLPEGDVIIVGPHAERLAEPLGLPLIRSGDMAPYGGSFCAMVEDSPQDREWLDFVRGGRGIHLVVGDEPWHDLLVDEPVAVSWVGESAVVDALYLAFTLGATLGFGTVDGFVSTMVRPQPTDVALAIRRIVGRR
ncbi:MAG: hypothetical protein GY926_16290 [bacterium]|nr:hypothetical protein [bacterium]